jgi:hypothetical protein
VKELARYPLGADITDSATSLTVGTLVSGVAVDDDALPLYAAIEDGTSNYESVLVTAISTTTWTIVRAQESTTGVAHSAGASISVIDTDVEREKRAGASDNFYIFANRTGAQTTGVKNDTLRVVPVDARLVGAWANLGTACAGSAFTLDVQKNGTDCLTAVTIADAGTVSAFKNAGAGTAFTAGDVVGWEITQIGSGTAGSDLGLVLLFERV